MLPRDVEMFTLTRLQGVSCFQQFRGLDIVQYNNLLFLQIKTVSTIFIVASPNLV